MGFIDQQKIDSKEGARPPVVCAVCHGVGRLGFLPCRECRGMGIGLSVRDKWLYWDFPLTRYNVALNKTRHWLEITRAVFCLLLGLNSWVWAIFLFNRAGLIENLIASPANFWFILNLATPLTKFLFWAGVILFTYAWYRSIRVKSVGAKVETHAYGGPQAERAENYIDSFDKARRLHGKNRLAVAQTFTPEALTVIAQGYKIADKTGAAMYEPAHLFASLLDNNRVANIFIRLGIPAALLKKQLEQVLIPKRNSRSKAISPNTAVGLYAVLFAAYNRAYDLHQDYVSVTELLDVVVAGSETLQDILFNLEIDKQKLENVVEWARIRERLYRQYKKFRHAAGMRSTKGMDKAMTALATPYLNHFSEDVTLMAQFGQTEVCIAREAETEEIFRIVEGGGMNVLLVGEVGVGKRSIVEGIAERMVTGDVPRRLYDKRLVRLSTSALLAGTSPSGAVERIRAIMAEIARARNIILFINNIHELVGVSAGAGGEESLDVAGALAEFLNGGNFMTIATSTPDAYGHAIARSPLGNTFAKVTVNELEENAAIQVLESKVGYVEYKQQVFFAYSAIEKAVQFAKRYLHDITLPGSAQELMTEAASFGRAKKGINSLVTAEEVAAVVAQKTKIPVASVTANETTKLLHLEEEMHRRVVGQDEAVELVANALRRSRAEVRAQTRPIANFLFLGPTGVGKTELAKTIAEVYFGGETRMARFDMSEYQDKLSLTRLIGSPGQKGSGILTEAIKRNPFTLLLLDEIEKADPDILNLFLQVMDDGRLTDSTGRMVDFTNVILIATSNAGTQYVQEQMRAGLSSEVIKDRLLHGELKDNFRPEFLNRFDGIVLFKALTRDDIKKVAALMLKRVEQDLEARGMALEITPEALEFLADVGFDPEFGARPMRRALEDKVENKLAELLLSNQLKRRDTVVIGAGGSIYIK